MKRKALYDIAVIGSHGYRAQYGGWDALVNMLVDRGSKSASFRVFNAVTTQRSSPPANVRLTTLPLRAEGFQGLFFDFVSVLMASFSSRCLLLLGAQGLPLALLLKACCRPSLRIVVNPGGVEWERPKFGYFARAYLRWVFKLACRYADVVVLDNEHYFSYVGNDSSIRSKCVCLPYGGAISERPADLGGVMRKYGVNFDRFYLSISRALEDNQLRELCKSFVSHPESPLVLISNFDSSTYGKEVFRDFGNVDNIRLINGVYNRAELDSLRLGCHAYVHTHKLCGSAPSLIEMMVAQRPLYCFDVPQNRYTTSGNAEFFSDFDELHDLIRLKRVPTPPPSDLLARFDWARVVGEYVRLCTQGAPD